MTQSILAHSTSPRRDRTHGEILFILSGLFLAIFLAALDQTIVAPALPAIGRDVGRPQDLTWVVTAFFFAVTVATPLYGKLADIRGRRLMLLVGIGLFVGGSLVCALARSLSGVIAGRVLQGAGAGGVSSISMVVVADLVPPNNRARYLAYTASIVLSGNLLGPVLGEWLISEATWRAIFWLNIPLGTLAFWTSYVTLKRLPRHERPHRLDLLGALYLVLGTLALLFLLSWGGQSVPWRSATALGLEAAVLALATAFLLRLNRAPEPFIPPALLRHPVARPAMLTASLSVGALSALIVYIPLYLSLVGGLNSTGIGLAMIPLAAGPAAGALICARTARKVSDYTRMPRIGLGVAVVMCTVLALIQRPILLISLVALGLTSLAAGAVMITCTIAIQNALMPHQFGTATATMSFLRALGSTILVALVGAAIFGGSTPGRLFSDAAEASKVTVAVYGMSFQRLFGCVALSFTAALICLTRMERRPLRSHVVSVEESSPGATCQ